MRDGPRCLVPYDRREGITVEEAAEISGRAVRTVRWWCEQHDIGRRVGGGAWVVSRIALAMFLDGDEAALRAYLNGDRTSTSVRSYFDLLGLGELPRVWAGRVGAAA